MSAERFEFSKDNLDFYLKELAKEIKTEYGKNVHFEIILVGGAAVMSSYGFRCMTTDIDAEMGHTVNFKTYKQSYKSKKKLHNPEEKQLVFEDTHKAIIDADTWARMQELRKNKRRPTRTGKTNLFSGIVRCADCGEKLYYCTSKNF